MYHFCINKFTLVESAKLFLHFQLFIYDVIDFQTAEFA